MVKNSRIHVIKLAGHLEVSENKRAGIAVRKCPGRGGQARNAHHKQGRDRVPAIRCSYPNACHRENFEITGQKRSAAREDARPPVNTALLPLVQLVDPVD
jgi:hypothetical protein